MMKYSSVMDIEDVKEIIGQLKGLSLVLNGEKSLGSDTQTLSTYILNNSFSNFNEYIEALRSPYKRRIKKVLKKRDKLLIRNFNKNEFSQEHYKLYRSVMDRTDSPLEVLNIDYFQSYEGELIQFLDAKDNRLLGFIQLKEIGNLLYFLFCGFKMEDNKTYDLYYNMLLTIVGKGIEICKDGLQKDDSRDWLH